jgi:hypothetical protein
MMVQREDEQGVSCIGPCRHMSRSAVDRVKGMPLEAGRRWTPELAAVWFSVSIMLGSCARKSAIGMSRRDELDGVPGESRAVIEWRVQASIEVSLLDVRSLEIVTI